MRYIILGISLALGACGFTPLYGQGGGAAPAAQELSAVSVPLAKERPYQLLRNYLIEKWNPGNPLYRLDYRLFEERYDLGIRRDASASFARLTIEANFQLIRLSDNALLADGGSKALVSYNIVQSSFANLSAEEDARERALRQIAEDITIKLASYFTGPDAGKPLQRRTPAS
ncbi:MAG: LPS assembly lipoprotein LptE [Dongiaceae bacterium]